jgi:hypothetical protein
MPIQARARMPCCGSAAGSFFVACVRDVPDREFPERDDAARGRDDDRVLDAMRPRYPRTCDTTAGDTLSRV